MTRRDYILIAAALNDAKPIMHDGTDWYKGWFRSCERLADALGRDNPRFDRARFLKAAGVQS